MRGPQIQNDNGIPRMSERIKIKFRAVVNKLRLFTGVDLCRGSLPPILYIIRRCRGKPNPRYPSVHLRLLTTELRKSNEYFARPVIISILQYTRTPVGLPNIVAKQFAGHSRGFRDQTVNYFDFGKHFFFIRK